jgi:hypothetical protein
MAAVFIVALAVAGHSAWELWHVYANVRSIAHKVDQLKQQLNRPEQLDMNSVHGQLLSVATNAQEARASLLRMRWLRLLPLVSDWQHSVEQLLSAGRWAALGGAELAAAIAPQQERILRANEGRGRFQALAQALATSRTEVERAARLWQQAADEVSSVDIDDLPDSLLGVSIKARAREAVRIVGDAGLVAPWLPHLPFLLGADSPRRYLIIFQDSDEMRATGGFLGAFAHLELVEGAITLTSSHDIFELPGHACASAPLPDEVTELVKAAGSDAGTFSLLPSYFWRNGIPVQDSNWWPDLGRSMALFLCHYSASGQPPVDGVILVDMAFLVGVLQEIGPVQVEGYSEPFSSDPVTYLGVPLPQVVLQILKYAERVHVHEPNRKRVVGDLGRAILERLYELSPSQIRRVGERILQLAMGGHLLLYFPSGELQRLVEGSPLGGKVAASQVASDYLYLVEANYAPCKCDLFVQRQVEHLVAQRDGTILRTVTLSYHNPAHPDGWLIREGGTYAVRAYVPRGSTLRSSSGQSGEPVIYEDGGATVFAFLVTMPAPGSARLSFTYELPRELSLRLIEDGYVLVLQGQPHLSPVPHVLNIEGTRMELLLRKALQEVGPVPIRGRK